MDWRICLLCQFTRSNGKMYSAMGRSGWICDDCIKLEICKACKTRRWKLLVSSLLMMGLVAFIIFYAADKVSGDQSTLTYLMSGQYMQNLNLKIADWLSGFRILSWENVLLVSLFFFVIALALGLIGLFLRPTFTKNKLDSQGNQTIARLVYQKKL